MPPSNEPVFTSLLRAFCLLSAVSCLALPFFPWISNSEITLSPLLFWLEPAALELPASVWKELCLTGLVCSTSIILFLGMCIALFCPAPAQLLTFLEMGFWVEALSALGIVRGALFSQNFQPTAFCLAAVILGLSGGFLSKKYRKTLVP